MLPCIVQLRIKHVVLLVDTFQTVQHRTTSIASHHLVTLFNDLLGGQSVRLVVHDLHPLQVVLLDCPVTPAYLRTESLAKGLTCIEAIVHAVVIGTVQAVIVDCIPKTVPVHLPANELIFKGIQRSHCFESLNPRSPSVDLRLHSIQRLLRV
jgi:hypothetical protein